MKKYFLAFVLGTSLTMLAACGGGGENNTATDAPTQGGGADTAEAEKLYQQSCAGCHGGNLEGGNGPKLQQVGGKYNKDEIENIILNGQGSMPGGMLKGEEASTVASWLADQN